MALTKISLCWSCISNVEGQSTINASFCSAITLFSVQHYTHISAGYLCKQTKISCPAGHLHVECLMLYAWSLLSPWRFQLAEMTHLPFFPHSSLGMQLILSTTLNQKQTWAQGTNIPEDKEGTNTVHQWRKQLGQIFSSFCKHSFPTGRKGQEGAFCIS